MALYIVPMVGNAVKGDWCRPKYLDGLKWDGVDIGQSFLVTTPVDLSANADVITLPVDLDNTVAVVVTQNALESLGLPAQWVTAGMTYRQVLRVVLGFSALLMRTYFGMRAVRLQLVGNLDMTLGALPASTRNNIAAAIDSFALDDPPFILDRSAFTGATTIREALRSIGQQFAQGALALPPWVV